MDKSILEAAVGKAKPINPGDLRQQYMTGIQKKESDKKEDREERQQDEIKKANKAISDISYACERDASLGATCTVVFKYNRGFCKDDIVNAFDIVYEYCNTLNLNPKIMYSEGEKWIVVQW